MPSPQLLGADRCLCVIIQSKHFFGLQPVLIGINGPYKKRATAMAGIVTCLLAATQSNQLNKMVIFAVRAFLSITSYSTLGTSSWVAAASGLGPGDPQAQHKDTRSQNGLTLSSQCADKRTPRPSYDRPSSFGPIGTSSGPIRSFSGPVQFSSVSPSARE